MWRPRAPAWSRAKPPAEFILPAQAVLCPVAPRGPDWIHEIKADGYRVIARKDDDAVRLWTRRAVDYTQHFPRIEAAVAALPVMSCVLDGEAVCFGDNCHDFHDLRSRAGRRAATLIAFDLLMVDGVDMRGDPLKLRREQLQGLLCPAPPEGLLFSAAIADDGPDRVRGRLPHGFGGHRVFGPPRRSAISVSASTFDRGYAHDGARRECSSIFTPLLGLGACTRSVLENMNCSSSKPAAGRADGAFLAL